MADFAIGQFLKIILGVLVIVIVVGMFVSFKGIDFFKGLPDFNKSGEQTKTIGSNDEEFLDCDKDKYANMGEPPIGAYYYEDRTETGDVILYYEKNSENYWSYKRGETKAEIEPKNFEDTSVSNSNYVKRKWLICEEDAGGKWKLLENGIKGEEEEELTTKTYKIDKIGFKIDNEDTIWTDKTIFSDDKIEVIVQFEANCKSVKYDIYFNHKIGEAYKEDDPKKGAFVEAITDTAQAIKNLVVETVSSIDEKIHEGISLFEVNNIMNTLSEGEYYIKGFCFNEKDKSKTTDSPKLKLEKVEEISESSEEPEECTPLNPEDIPDEGDYFFFVFDDGGIIYYEFGKGYEGDAWYYLNKDNINFYFASSRTGDTKVNKAWRNCETQLAAEIFRGFRTEPTNLNDGPENSDSFIEGNYYCEYFLNGLSYSGGVACWECPNNYGTNWYCRPKEKTNLIYFKSCFEDPTEEANEICDNLNIEYDDDFVDYWKAYRKKQIFALAENL